MAVVYIPIVAVFSSVMLGIAMSLLVGLAMTTNHFSRRVWRGALSAARERWGLK